MDIELEQYQEIMSNKWVYPVEEIRLSHSSMGQFKSCPRKWEFSKMYACPVRTSSLATMSGSVVHIGFQDYMTNGDLEQAIWKMMMAYDWVNAPAPLHTSSIETCVGVLQKLVEHYDSACYELVWIQSPSGEDIPAVEVPFQINFNIGVNLPSKDGKETKFVPFTYIGYIDAIVKNKNTGEIIVEDIKTTRTEPSDIAAMYKHSEQCVPYAIAINKVLGEPISALHVSYIIGCMSVDSPQVLRMDYYKTSEDVEDWARSMLVYLNNLKLFIENQWFPRDGGSCVAYGNRCAFFEECAMSRKRPQDIQNNLLYRHGEIKPMGVTPLVTIELALGE